MVVATGGLAGDALRHAIGEIGVREEPPGSNRGERVEAYLASVGVAPGFSWCAAFVHWCFDQAARERGVANPFPRTGGCLDAWNRVARTAPQRLLPVATARADPALVRPGMVLVLDHGHGLGHVGFVRLASGAALRTVEGNGSAAGSREGTGVFDLSRRTLASPELRGFIDFTA